MNFNNNWYLQYKGKEISVTIPSTVHGDLIQNELLEDPYIGMNETKIQWVDKQDFTYKKQFTLTKEELEKDHIVITFKGLDTYTSILVNNQLVKQTDNMFVAYDIDIKEYVKEENEIIVIFHSPIQTDLPKVKETGFEYMAINDDSKMGGLNENKVSIYARKAPFHYGWDWGPRIVTSGFYKDVNLEIYNDYHLNDITFDNAFEADETLLNVYMTIQSTKEQTVLYTLDIENNSTHEEVITLFEGINHIKKTFKLKNINKWYPNGYGEQTLYNLTSKLNKEVVNTFKKGFSDTKVVIEKDEYGESFYFTVNGKKVFAKGANHIPNSIYLPDVKKEHYYHELLSAKEANYNMIRVWGGGVYEDDLFYEICDELGLLVWQDFMFACSMYPGDEAFFDNVKNEAIYQVNRLKKYTSIALFCGNNENDNAWGWGSSESGWGWKEHYTKEQQDLLTKYYLDLFHDILPEIVEDYSTVFYWPSSPYSGHVGTHSTYSSTSGDMHYWDVWHGRKPFASFKDIKPRFMSEFGIQSFPSIKTIKSYAEDKDLNIYSKVMELHQKSPIGNEVIMHYIAELYKMPTGLINQIYLSQLIQAEGIKFGVEHMRRNIHNTMGIMYWQINDCYPVASWSSIDYFGRLKALHYYAKHFYNPTLVSFTKEDTRLEIHFTNDSFNDYKNILLKLTHMTLSGKTITQEMIPFDSLSMSNKHIYSLDLTKYLNDETLKEETYFKAEVQAKEEVLSTNRSFLSPIKHVELVKPTLDYMFTENEENIVLSISSDTFVKSLEIDFESIDCVLEDNFFDMDANKTYTINISKSRNSNITKTECENQIIFNHVENSY